MAEDQWACWAERWPFPVGDIWSKGFMHAWPVSGRDYYRIPAVHASELVRRIQSYEDFTLLDVRTIAEYEKGRLPNALHIYLGELPKGLDEIRKERPVTTFGGSG